MEKSMEGSKAADSETPDGGGQGKEKIGPVPENLRGITDPREMDLLEAQELERVTGQFLKEIGTGHRFSAADICRMHREWLGGIYPWAGEYRQAPVHRERVRFSSPAQIPALMQEFDAMVLTPYTPCSGSPEQIAESLAVVHTELVLIHPFPDGNIRLALLLAALMAAQADLPRLDFSLLRGEAADAYLDALWAGIGRDYKPMTELFREVIRRSPART